MGRMKRYRNAWSRHHRSGGFGIHSPFAFNFVQNVIGERCPYYAYAKIAKWRRAAQPRGRWHRSTVISQHDAELLFRITNFFNPSHLLVVGAHDGVVAATLKAVSAKSTLHLYAPHLCKAGEAQKMLLSIRNQLHLFSDLGECMESYFSQAAEATPPFVLIDEICDEMELELVKSAILPMVCHLGVVIVRNLNHNPFNARLWVACLDSASRGQSYTNDKTGILVANPKLQREHFTLWL